MRSPRSSPSSPTVELAAHLPGVGGGLDCDIGAYGLRQLRAVNVLGTGSYLRGSCCSLACEKNRTIDMAGGLGLVSIMLHNVGEGLLKRLP